MYTTSQKVGHTLFIVFFIYFYAIVRDQNYEWN